MKVSQSQQRRHLLPVLRRALELARPSWGLLTAAALLSLLSAPVLLLLPVPLKIAVDSELGGHPLPAWTHPLLGSVSRHPAAGRGLALCACLLLGIVVLRSLLSAAFWLLATYTGEKLVHDLRGQLLFRCQRLSLSAHRSRGASDVANRIQQDASAIRGLFLRHLIPLLSSAFLFAAVLAVIARLCWPVAAIAAAAAPAIWYLARRSSRQAEQHIEQLGRLDNSTALLLQETFRGLCAVKAFGQEASHDERFRRRSRQRMAEQLRLASLQAGHQLLFGCCLALAAAAALFAGVSAVRHQSLTVGGLVLVLAYMVLLYEPLQRISSGLSGVEPCLRSLERAFALLEDAPELETAPPAPAPVRVRGEVEFRNVSFRYSSSESPVLKDISFRVPAGTTVGIVGANGSGKSTLVNLLTRFYDPFEGEILLDRSELRHFSLSVLRHQFAVIPQEPMLFSTTVAANIAYAAPQASREAVIGAAKLANADDFIRRLPQGYDTPIGQGGVVLSAGERYRIAIARAFLKDAPLLVVDEPNSAIDLCTEELIFESLDALMQERTTFLIAHRLNTIERCEMVLVLQDGTLRSITSGSSGRAADVARIQEVDELPLGGTEQAPVRSGCEAGEEGAGAGATDLEGEGPIHDASEEAAPTTFPASRRGPDRAASGLFLVSTRRESRNP